VILNYSGSHLPNTDFDQDLDCVKPAVPQRTIHGTGCMSV